MDINDVEPQFTKDSFKFLIDENQTQELLLDISMPLTQTWELEENLPILSSPITNTSYLSK